MYICLLFTGLEVCGHRILCLRSLLYCLFSLTVLDASYQTENCVISITVYSNSTQDVVNPLLYQGFIEETVELLELEQTQFSVSC